MNRREVADRLAAAIPANVRAVCRTLAAAGFQAVAVGGAVRDAVLGREPGDWDVASSATPDEVMALFRRTVPTGIQHGTVTIVTGQGEASHVEVTTFRGEGAYTDSRRPDSVTFGVPLDDDLARRDLRVNAIAYDPATNEIHDPYGGLADIEARLLRAVGPSGDAYIDAVARFTEDGLRVMRAVRFAAVLEFALDPETERGIAEPSVLASLDKVSRERVSDELRKLLAARQPSRGLAPALRTGILSHVLPSVFGDMAPNPTPSPGAPPTAGAALAPAPSMLPTAEAIGRVDAFAAWRDVASRRGDVRTSVHVVGANTDDPIVARWRARVDAARSPEARLGALIADLAAPDPNFRRLDRDAEKRALALLKDLKFSNDEAATAAALVGIASAGLRADWTRPEMHRLFADLTRARLPAAIDFWRACAAPSLGALFLDDGAAMLADAAAEILARPPAEAPLSTKELAITGKDLMTELGLAPGRRLGALIAMLFDRALDDPSLNTRDQLIGLARLLQLEVPNEE